MVDVNIFVTITMVVISVCVILDIHLEQMDVVVATTYN